MKPRIAFFILFTLIGIPAKADINSDIEALTDGYDSIRAAIEKAPEKDRSRLYEKLREQARAMAFESAVFPNGSNTLNKENSDMILVDLVYGAFSADQAHLNRVIIHTKDRARAVAIMPDRARSLIALFPVCPTASDSPVDLRSPAFSESIYFMQYLARAYPFIPDSLVKEVRQRMPQWKGEERIPGLLVLAESGQADAKAELNYFTSEPARKLKIAFRAVVDSAQKGEENKNAQQAAPSNGDKPSN